MDILWSFLLSLFTCLYLLSSNTLLLCWLSVLLCYLCLFCFLGALYVIVEYCRYGCLREHLIKNHSSFDASDSKTTKDGDYSTSVKSEDSGMAQYVNSPTEVKKISTYKVPPALGIKDLVCFAYQIAKGMEYLASRKVRMQSIMSRLCTV